MRVSVVIPAYNSAAFVGEAVQSVLRQSRPAHEIIVVDDGSTDATADRVSKLPVSLIRQPNGGAAAARNTGVAAVTGDLVAFLDADDVWHPEKLALQVPFFENDAPLALLGSDTFDWPAATLPIPLAGPAGDVSFEQLAIRNRLVTSTILVRRSVLTVVGPFDTRLQGPEDYDLWLRIARQHRCAVLSAKLTGYRTVAGSLSKNAGNMDAGMKLILSKLNDAGAFRGRPLLRRKSWGYYHYSAGYMHHMAGHRTTAVKHLVQSVLTWPGVYSREDVRYRFGRLRLLAGALRGAP